jgi:hypothetical protein
MDVMWGLLRAALAPAFGILLLAGQTCFAQGTTPGPEQPQLNEIDKRLSELERLLSVSEGRLSAIQRQVAEGERRSSALQPFILEAQHETQKLGEARAAFEKLNDALHATARELSSAELTLGGQYFQIFAALVALGGAVGVIGAIIIKQYVTRAADVHIQEEFERQRFKVVEAAKKSATLNGQLSLTDALGHFALAVYECYRSEKEQFATFLKGQGEETDDDFKRNVQMAASLAGKGLGVCKSSKLIQDEITSGNDELWIVYSRLLNHWVYHRTIDLGCRPPATEVREAEISRVLDGAQECLRLSQDPRRRTDWYMLRETGAFAMLVHGSAVVKQQAREIVRTLLLRQGTPHDFDPPTVAWIKGMRERVYYPAQPDGSREDTFGLGIFDVSPWEAVPRALRLM